MILYQYKMKIAYRLIVFLVLLSSSQLGFHFWPNWSLVNGIKIDYLSPTVYLTDLIFVWMLIVSIIKFHKSKFLKILAAIFLGLFFLSGKGNISSAYWSFRYLQVPALAWIIYINDKYLNLYNGIKKYLTFPLLFTLILEIWQFAIKKSTGWWWIFGERTYSLATPNIATIDLFGDRFLRPYSTFSHPNALAGWLLLTAFILWKNRPARILAIGGILLTFSRNAILAVFIGTVSLSVFKNWSQAQSLITFSEFSSRERLILNHSSLKVFSDFPIFGIGPGKLLTALPNYFPSGFWNIQPPHNVFLLILTETGIFGFAILLIGFLKLYPVLKRAPEFFPGLIAVFSTSLLDHYWLTSQQDRTILGIYLGLILIRSFRGDNQPSVSPFTFRIRRNFGAGR